MVVLITAKDPLKQMFCHSLHEGQLHCRLQDLQFSVLLMGKHILEFFSEFITVVFIQSFVNHKFANFEYSLLANLWNLAGKEYSKHAIINSGSGWIISWILYFHIIYFSVFNWGHRGYWLVQQNAINSTVHILAESWVEFVNWIRIESC